MGARVKVSQTEIDLGWREIKRQVKSFKNGDTSIGYWSSGGTDDTDLAVRAVVNEFGVKRSSGKGTPSRPFMRMAYDNNKDKTWKQIEKEYNRVLQGQATARQALSRLGEWYKGLIQLTIKKGSFAPLSPVTIKRKKSSKPLIDTGQLWRGVDHRETVK